MNKLESRKSVKKSKRIIEIILGWIFWVLIVGLAIQSIYDLAPKKTYHIKEYKTWMQVRNIQESHLSHITDDECKKNSYNHSLPISYPDYYPHSLVYRGHLNLIQYNHPKNMYTISLKAKPRYNEYTPINELRYKSANNNYHQILMTTFNGQKYDFIDNGKKINYKVKKHQVYIKMHQGMNRIRIHIPIMWYRYSSMLMSATGVIGLGLLDRKKRKLNDKINNKKN